MGVDIDWSLWRNPIDSIGAAIDKGMAAAKTRRSAQILQAFADNPDNKAAAAAFMADNPSGYASMMDAQTSQLKAKKALADADDQNSATAIRRAYIAGHPELFGGQADQSDAPPAPAPADNPTPSVVLASMHGRSAPAPASAPATTAAMALSSLARSPAPPVTTTTALLAGPSTAPAPASNSATSMLSTLNNPAPSPLAGRTPTMSAATLLAASAPNGLRGSAPAATDAPAATTQPDQSKDVVVTARRRRPAPTLADVAMVDPDAADRLLKFQTDYANYDGVQRKAIADKAETWAVLGHQLAQMPYAQRAAFIDQNRRLLHSHQISDAEIDAFDPTDAAIKTEMNLAIGAKGIIAQQESDRSFGETVRSHRAGEASAAASRAVTMRGQNMADARAREANSVAATTASSQSIDYYADAMRSGAPLPSFGMGRQAAALRMAIAQRAAEKDAAEGKGGSDFAASRARYAGLAAGERTLGNRTANIDLASNEAGNAIKLAREASAALSRSGFLPLARVQQMVQNGNNDPNLRRLVTANTAVVNTYARAISPSGVPHVSDQEHARQMLSTAFDQTSYNAVLSQMQREIAFARKAPGQVRNSMDAAIIGHGPAGAPRTARNPATGQRVQLVGGRWVPIP